METAEYTRFKTELATATSSTTNSSISLEIVLNNGKTYTVNAKEDRSFVSTPHVSDSCFIVMGAGEVVGGIKEQKDGKAYYNGNYTKLILPLSLISYILIHYVDDVVTTIAQDVTENEETTDDETATE